MTEEEERRAVVSGRWSVDGGRWTGVGLRLTMERLHFGMGLQM